VEEIAWDYNEISVDTVMGDTIKAVAKVAARARSASPGAHLCPDEEVQLEEDLLESMAEPDGGVPPELLTPAISRDPSPRRLRSQSKSPARWKLMRSLSDAMQNVMEQKQPGLYGELVIILAYCPEVALIVSPSTVPVPMDPRPGRHVRHLDFNHFRTIGMRRSVEEGVNSRFVTGERVQAILKVRHHSVIHIPLCTHHFL